MRLCTQYGLQTLTLIKLALAVVEVEEVVVVIVLLADRRGNEKQHSAGAETLVSHRPRRASSAVRMMSSFHICRSQNSKLCLTSMVVFSKASFAIYLASVGLFETDFLKQLVSKYVSIFQ